MPRHIAAVLLCLAAPACTTVYLTSSPGPDGQAPQDAPGQADDGGGGQPTSDSPADAPRADVGQALDTGTLDSGTPDAQPAPCSRETSYDWLCKNYQYGRLYAWACGSWDPILPSCQHGACNCQGTLLGNPDGGPDYLCCDVP